jgi:threonine dehydrogenase-like Zn-dependent dehydrogenase
VSRSKIAPFYGSDDLQVEAGVEKTVDPSDVADRPLVVGLCGTDAHILRGTFPAVPGTVLGHEIAGEVVALGAAVGYLVRGDLVAVEPHVYCGHCRFCRVGAEHLCVNKRIFGIHLDGGLATHQVVPARCANKVPNGMNSEVAALCKPLDRCVHSVNRLDLHPERRDAARAFSADHLVDPDGQAAGDLLANVTEGPGFSTVIEAVDSAAALEFAIAHSAQGGQILVFDVAAPAFQARVTPFDVFAKELTIIGMIRNAIPSARTLAAASDSIHDLDRVHAAMKTQRQRVDAKVSCQRLVEASSPYWPTVGSGSDDR